MSIASFGRAISYYAQAEVWVAYISKNKIFKPHEVPPLNEIVMLMSVSTSMDLPFTNNLGITRVDFKDKTQSKLACKLHSFAACIMSMRYPNKLYMINVPMPYMRDLMIQEFTLKQKQQALSVLDMENMMQKDKQTLVKLIFANDSQQAPYQFVLYDWQNNKIFDKEIKSVEEIEVDTHAWFFHNEDQLRNIVRLPLLLCDLLQLSKLENFDLSEIKYEQIEVNKKYSQKI